MMQEGELMRLLQEKVAQAKMSQAMEDEEGVERAQIEIALLMEILQEKNN